MTIGPKPLSYKPDRLSVGAVHVGLGNFARAFIGEYFHDVAERGHKDWGYVAIAPSDRQRLDLQNLQRQSYVYHLLKRNGEELCTRVGALLGVMIGKFSPVGVINRLSNPTTKVATLTITQSGYCLGVDKKLEATPQVEGDISAIRDGKLNLVQTAPGWIVAALHQRYKSRAVPFTVVSCDNLPRNGRLLQKVVESFAGAIDPTFLAYVQNEARFPNSVVDRVTPHQNYAHTQKHLMNNYGISDDLSPVVCEPYRKLVIEDDFTGLGRPPFDQISDEKARAHYVSDVGPYEDRKIRLLNGSHLAIGLVSKILQITTVYEATRDDNVRTFWLSFLNQAAEALKPMAVKEYVKDTVDRLDNPHLTDQTDRLLASTAMKIGPRLFNEPGLRKGLPTDASAFAVAAWLRYMTARDESGNPYNLHPNDVSKIDELQLTTPEKVRLNLPRILTKDAALAKSPAMERYVETVLKFSKLIHDNGLRKAIQTVDFTPSLQQKVSVGESAPTRVAPPAPQPRPERNDP